MSDSLENRMRGYGIRFFLISRVSLIIMKLRLMMEVSSVVQSINTRADLVVNATSFLGLGSYGKIMVGDKGFEFFDDRNKRDYIQIPWEEIDYVLASVMFGGRWIPRFAIRTKSSGTFTFSSKKNARTAA